MTQAHWNNIKEFIRTGFSKQLPQGFIIDSPWLPGWYGISTLDYFTSDQAWFESNLAAHKAFPDVWFLPGFWSEYGMCSEPSAFGSKMMWDQQNLPHAAKMFETIQEAAKLKIPNVKTDGLLPFIINRLKNSRKLMEEHGHSTRFAVSRGPLNIASFLFGTTELMMAMVTDPEETLVFISKINQFIVDWLRFQKENFPSIEGILILDDIVGFIDEENLKTFALPFLKEEFGAFESEVRLFHNDANGVVCAPYLQSAGINMFNFSFNHPIDEMRKLCGDEIVLLGNIPPRDVLANGSKKQISESLSDQYHLCKNLKKIIWSCGGGIPQDVSSENLNFFTEALTDLYKK